MDKRGNDSMGKKKKKQVRAEPDKKNISWLCSSDAFDILCGGSYTRLIDNPEIVAAVNKICNLISSMTIHLMENTDAGDKRLKNELSRKIDITPNRFMTRKTFISALVREILLEGDGNAVVYAETTQGYLKDLQLIPAGHFSFVPDGYGYLIRIDGEPYTPDELLHFVINPSPDYPWKGCGYRTALKDIANNLKQATATKKGFMESKWKPSVIVKVDSMSDELSSLEGRKKILNDYVANTDAGEPWVIPADAFDVEVVKPLSLTDLALSDAVMLDKKTIAAILDVPAFVVGAGEFDSEEWNNFINTRIRPLCNALEQELTKKLLINPDWYFRFNVRSLYAYDITTLSNVGANLYTRGIMTGNEVRDAIGYSPMEGLDELVILENYIPQGMIGDQKKLKGGKEGEEE